MGIKINGFVALLAVFTGISTGNCQPAGNSKNILIIMTDQQSADAMSIVSGKKYLHTPNMDAIAEKGIVFSNAYSANPLCIPSRSSMVTGRYPSELGILDNEGAASGIQGVKLMGTYFTEAGYETGYVGKWHVPAYPLKNQSVSGFQWLENNQLGGADSVLPASAIRFINKKRSNPFLLVVSFINPHNINEWTRGEALPDGNLGNMPAKEALPPLIANNAPSKNENDINRDMRKAIHANPKFPVGGFDELQWRQYRWAYYRLIEKVDAHIGTVINALKASGQYDNTLIVFLSDHGDMQGAHGWNQKTVFYEESAKVPFVLSGPGLKTGRSEVLINTGVDLIPTLIAYAGLETDDTLSGHDVLKPGYQSNYVVVSNKLSVGRNIFPGRKTFTPEGRMVRSQQYKYWVYDDGKQKESLFDISKDPGEMEDLARLPRYKQVLKQHRSYLKAWAQKYKDEKALQLLK